MRSYYISVRLKELELSSADTRVVDNDITSRREVKQLEEKVDNLKKKVKSKKNYVSSFRTGYHPSETGDYCDHGDACDHMFRIQYLPSVTNNFDILLDQLFSYNKFL